ncbi:hypothetical protein AQUCO_02700395v1 [Aquilegia coerulea]|uniref:Uncharacterized protein n=1 Tax=Aquilegia coerulea TaxID=218851 RepID=A0A2G5D6Q0_AQUCA|nr:hypothetical protein AQUCO_02700395v1 [Aquilegia coerulea]
MEQNSVVQREEKDQHVLRIWDVNQVQLASMEKRMSAMPRLLSNSAGQSSCCIFRVPQSQIDIDQKAYHPQIISIGPYHYGKQNLQMIQEHKWRFLGSIVARTRTQGLGLEDYLKAIKPLEVKARNCYSEVLDFNTDEFVEMMVLDGCFIIELFRIVGKVIQTDPDDPIFAVSWVFIFLLRDLIKLENQIPFFVLQTLFDLSKMPGEETSPTLVTLALRAFDYVIDRPDEIIEQYHSYCSQNGKHLLDLLRTSFIPTTLLERPPKGKTSTKVIQCVSKLRRAGIQFKVVKSDSFLDIKYRHGVIEMPRVTMDDFTCPFLLNCVAFEQCSKHCIKYMTTYATFMDCLINTFKDVEILCDEGIIENYFGTDGEVSHFFNILGKDSGFDILRCFLAELFDDVNEYYENNWHVQLASFKYTYFNTPWSFISALAALILLILTIFQTFFTIYPYYRPS